MVESAEVHPSKSHPSKSCTNVMNVTAAIVDEFRDMNAYRNDTILAGNIRMSTAQHTFMPLIRCLQRFL